MAQQTIRPSDKKLSKSGIKQLMEKHKTSDPFQALILEFEIGLGKGISQKTQKSSGQSSNPSKPKNPPK